MQGFDLSRFDTYREGNRLEVEQAKGGLPNSLWESYAAMANTAGGGASSWNSSPTGSCSPTPA